MIRIINLPMKKSHPAWVCGLKLTLEMESAILYVTPCVGVWIETLKECFKLKTDWSHPAWVCGLKHLRLPGGDTCTWSHPAWVYMD